jgi:hypothetical protein
MKRSTLAVGAVAVAMVGLIATLIPTISASARGSARRRAATSVSSQVRPAAVVDAAQVISPSGVCGTARRQLRKVDRGLLQLERLNDLRLLKTLLRLQSLHEQLRDIIRACVRGPEAAQSPAKATTSGDRSPSSEVDGSSIESGEGPAAGAAVGDDSEGDEQEDDERSRADREDSREDSENSREDSENSREDRED